MSSRITSREVAARAGVSQSTVSLVLSGKSSGRISAALQERVVQAATELHYQPHPSARALRSGRTRAVGLLVPDVTNPFLGRVLRGSQEVAREHGYAVALVEPGQDRDFQLEAMQTLRRGAVDGLLLFVLEPPPAPLLEDLAPLVLIEAECAGIPSVVLDIASGARQALSHLRGLGHTQIAYLGADIELETFRVRTREWERMTTELGMTPAQRVRYQRRSTFVLQVARQAARQLLLEEPRPTALFCDDDLLAAGARLAAADLGLAVPNDLSIVGFAGTVLSEATTPALTTVIAPAERLGAVAMETLLATIEGQPVAQAPAILPVHLEVRGSSAPPHGVRAPEER